MVHKAGKLCIKMLVVGSSIAAVLYLQDMLKGHVEYCSGS